jgi:hypothetical protein
MRSGRSVARTWARGATPNVEPAIVPAQCVPWPWPSVARFGYALQCQKARPPNCTCVVRIPAGVRTCAWVQACHSAISGIRTCVQHENVHAVALLASGNVLIVQRERALVNPIEAP